jgi:hypothetical protein
VSRVAAVESEVVVDVDTGYIAHEALRTLDGPLWLPLLALPRRVGPEPEADVPVSVDVTDSGGARIAEVPQAEVSRQLSAALAETLVVRLQRRGSTDAGQATGTCRCCWPRCWPGCCRSPPARTSRRPPASRPAAAARGNRLQLAQRRLRERLETELDLAEREETRQALPDADIAQVDEDARSTLNSAEAEIVRALRGCRLVVVPVDPDGPPTSFSVRMPARALVRTPPGRYASVARIRVGLLTASTHVDRVIEVLIPDGVRCVATAPTRPRRRGSRCSRRSSSSSCGCCWTGCCGRTTRRTAGSASSSPSWPSSSCTRPSTACATTTRPDSRRGTERC